MIQITPQGWPQGRGYAHGVVARGRMLFLAGQIGWDPVTARIVDGGFAEQAGRALDNVRALLTAAGAEPQHVVRMTWFVTDADAYRESGRALGQAYRERFGRHYPPMSVVIVAGLLEPGALLEIEATAVIPDSPPTD